MDNMQKSSRAAYMRAYRARRKRRDQSAGSPVDVHEKALKSAQRSATTRRREVLQFLLCLKEYAEAVYTRDGLGEWPKTWFHKRGYEYAPGDSQTTSTKHGEEREVQIGDTRVQLTEHVTLFPNTRDCVSVYFVRDDVDRRLVIGYIGPHMKTAGGW